MSFKHYLIKIGIYATRIICIKSPNKIGFIGVLIMLCRLIFVLLAGNCTSTWLVLLAAGSHAHLQ